MKGCLAENTNFFESKRFHSSCLFIVLPVLSHFGFICPIMKFYYLQSFGFGLIFNYNQSLFIFPISNFELIARFLISHFYRFSYFKDPFAIILEAY